MLDSCQLAGQLLSSTSNVNYAVTHNTRLNLSLENDDVLANIA